MPSTISAGTTAGTAIAVAGDTTGNLAFQTNGTTTAMTIDTSQNVGVGTTSPQSKLDVYVTRTSSTNAIALTLSDNVTGSQTNGVYKAIRSSSNGGSSVSEIRFLETDGSNNNTGIAFATAPTAGGLTERGRFDSTGNFLFNSGYGSVATAYGCRAWVNWNGTGSSSSIRGSGNVSSVTDNGTGDYTINFTTALIDTNYTANFSISSDDNGTFGNNGGTNTGVFSNFSSNVLVAPTTSAVRVGTSWTGAGRPNPTYCCVVVFR